MLAQTCFGQVGSKGKMALEFDDGVRAIMQSARTPDFGSASS